MDTSAFALWKFKTIEGVIVGAKSGDVCTTHFDNGLVRGDITYNPTTEKMMMMVNGETTPLFVCSFSDAVPTMTKHKLYTERPELERHSSSYIKYGHVPDV